MTLKGQQRIVPHHAGPIVHNADQLAAATFYLDTDASGTCVKCIFQELFDDRGRTIHYLAGGDLVGDQIRENTDATHNPSLEHVTLRRGARMTIPPPAPVI